MNDSKRKSQPIDKNKNTAAPEEDLKSLQQQELSGSSDEEDNNDLEYSDTDEDEDEGVGDGNVGRSISEY